jgi:hypothetical protein
MKIAQLAPLMASVPPRLYGGTERIVSYLTDELVRLGHEVTLFASADSITTAKLVSCTPWHCVPTAIAFLGRISPEKGADRAIRITRALGAFSSCMRAKSLVSSFVRLPLRISRI